MIDRTGGVVPVVALNCDDSRLDMRLLDDGRVEVWNGTGQRVNGARVELRDAIHRMVVVLVSAHPEVSK